MVLSSNHILIPYQVVYDNKLRSYGVLKEIKVTVNGYEVIAEDIIELQIVQECKSEDWIIMKRIDNNCFDSSVKLVVDEDSLPQPRDKVGIKDFPVGLLTSNSATKIRVESVPTKVIWYEARNPILPNKSKSSEFKGARIVRSGEIASPLPEDVIRVKLGRVTGSCGAPYFFDDKVVAFHFESSDEIMVGSDTSYVSYSCGYVLCRLPLFMEFYSKTYQML